ncbi:MAG: 1-deoxy-D-xylulose-5-phosphate synthase [Bifidobacteriaceae bacterium]|jgi:1-deoxy-D-xylulose-5-phosphate synthase|nr:1-deoxy-D-xylulose-5-phosphate synthase [Bifidobacteriaceae bacterium]
MVTGPAELKQLSPGLIPDLAADIRDFLVDKVSRSGGHLGPNLGVVELTIALHRVFDSPQDTLVFDTGHISYVHKILTGRRDFDHLRQEGGLSGYPSRAESVHDVLENTHASAGLSWAAGIAAGRGLTGQSARYTVAVVGDGALTGGMSWEALNNIAEANQGRLIVVINDNGRSYAPTIGGLAHHLSGLRTMPGYEQVLGWGKRHLRSHGGRFGRFIYGALHALKKGVKDVVAPQAMFEDLGLKYIGPVDGHDEPAVERALAQAKAFGGPVLVHVITEKGRGYVHAEVHGLDRFHSVGRIHPETGLALEPSRFGWSSVFSDELVRLGRVNPKIVGITAAMLEPVGLVAFAAEFPDRVFDVGIAEQHAAALAAGLAYTGLHPVVAVYASFLNRAFDQILMDCALHQAGVTFVLDRAGITGSDGPSHNGQWDMALFRLVPGLRLAAPRDAQRLRELLREAVAFSRGPTVVRYPKGPLPPDIPAVERVTGQVESGQVGQHDAAPPARSRAVQVQPGSVTQTAGQVVDVLARTGPNPLVLLVAIGSEAQTALEAARLLADRSVAATVVDPRWVYPVPDQIVRLAAAHELVVTVEDGMVSGGAGEAIARAIAQQGMTLPVVTCGLPQRFFSHASRETIAQQAGLTAQAVADAAAAALPAVL